MNALLRRFYALLLRLYPPGFRQAFGEEMQAVFAETLREPKRSRPGLALRELADLPAGLLAAWKWSMRRRGQLAERPALAAVGPGGFDSGRPTPTPWIQAVLAGLPFLLIGLLAGLPDLLSQAGDGSIFQLTFQLTLLYPLVLAGAGCLIWSALRGWPRWASGWYLLWMTVLLYPLSGLLDAGDSLYQSFLVGVYPLIIAWALYRIARRDRVSGVLAALPAMWVVWMPFMEQTPMTIIPAPLRGATFLSLCALSALAAVIFLRANRLAPALALALCASATGGALASYAGIYFGGILSFSEPGPSPRAALEAFLPGFIVSASIALGPQLACLLRDLGLRAGKWGRWSYRLALLGLLLMLAQTMRVHSSTMSGESGALLQYQAPLLAWILGVFSGWTGWIAALGVYAAGFAWLAWRAEQAGVLPGAGILALLFVLPLGVPGALLNSINVYMGWITPYRWAVNAALLAWLAAALWIVLRPRPNAPLASSD